MALLSLVILLLLTICPSGFPSRNQGIRTFRDVEDITSISRVLLYRTF
jgi:hypothetical protein